MDSRRYNILMLEAQQRAQEIVMNFQRQFYARQLGNARRNMAALQALQSVMQEPEPLEPLEVGLPEPQFEEELDG